MSTSKKTNHSAHAGQATTVSPSQAVPPGGSPPAVPVVTSPIDVTAVLNQISQAKAAVAQALLLIATVLLGKLTPKESRALLRARQKGQNLIPILVGLVVSKPTLAPTGIDAQTIQAKFQILQAFLLFATDVNGMSENVEDTLRQMQVELYKYCLDIYAIAERSKDSAIQSVVEQVKLALKTGPRSPSKKVTTVAKPVTLRVPASAAAAAQAAADAAVAAQSAASEGTGAASAPSAPASSGGSGGSSSGNGGSGQSAGGGTSDGSGTAGSTTPSVPAGGVPVYTPSGPAGTVPPTNGK